MVPPFLAYLRSWHASGQSPGWLLAAGARCPCPTQHSPPTTSVGTPPPGRRQTYLLPRDKARETAKEWFERYPKAAYLTQVESLEAYR
jgi:hypothetical protein